MKRYIPIIFSLVFTVSSCVTKKAVVPPTVSITPFSDTVRLTQGSIIYALPQSVFEIEVRLRKSVEKPGPYAAFAPDLIGINDVIKAESVKWSLVSLTINKIEEIDPSEYYVIKSDGNILSNSLAMKNYGLILDIARANVAGRESAYHEDETMMPGARFSDLGSTAYFSVQRDTAYRLVNADTTFIRIPYLVEKRRQLTPEQLAERAAKSLLELREGRHMILIGETNVYPQHNAAIDELNRLEKDYLSLFTGKSWSENVDMKFYFTPEAGKTQESAVLFRLSETEGVVTTGSSGPVTPVTITLTSAGKTSPLILSAELQNMAAAPENGLVYRIPEVVDIEIGIGGRKLLRTRAIVHQYGQKVTLPQNFIIAK